jgi:toxin ParE1/3/4
VSHAVRLSRHAIDDLDALHSWIESESDSRTADDCLGRLETRIAALSQFPDSGTPRDDLAPGLRTLSFQRRIVIAYAVRESVVTVLRVISGARELGPLL